MDVTWENRGKLIHFIKILLYSVMLTVPNVDLW
jgi:hypothetical protein